jgi:translation initiation factor 4G
LSTKILQVGITNLELLAGIIALVFDKALTEPNFSTMYAILCKKLSIQCPEFNDADGNKQSFRRILLNKCQEEFENKTPPNLDHVTEPLVKDELETKFRRRVLGNIKFIGELFKENMLPEKIMHECINSLIKDTISLDSDAPLVGVEDNIECLCKLITTVGKELDNVKSKSKVDDYFSKLHDISENKKFPSRVRFLTKVKKRIFH